jgi:hypothetical protein
MLFDPASVPKTIKLLIAKCKSTMQRIPICDLNGGWIICHFTAEGDVLVEHQKEMLGILGITNDPMTR